MKKLFLSLCCLLALSSLVFAESYGVVSFPAPGVWTPPISGVVKVQQIDVAGSAVATGTVTLSRLSADGATTNLLYTLTCASGAATLTSTNSSVYLIQGDTYLRAGTATNGSCRIIVAR